MITKGTDTFSVDPFYSLQLFVYAMPNEIWKVWEAQPQPIAELSKTKWKTGLEKKEEGGLIDRAEGI